MTELHSSVTRRFRTHKTSDPASKFRTMTRIKSTPKKRYKSTVTDVSGGLFGKTLRSVPSAPVKPPLKSSIRRNAVAVPRAPKLKPQQPHQDPRPLTLGGTKPTDPKEDSKHFRFSPTMFPTRRTKTQAVSFGGLGRLHL